jgi:hypothetical protein
LERNARIGARDERVAAGIAYVLYPLASHIRTQSARRGSHVTPKPLLSTRVLADMKKITLVTGLVFALVLPAAAVAKPSPDRGDKRAAKTECKQLRGHSDATREAFGTQYRNFGACVRAKAAEEAQEEQTAHKNAAKECKAERDADAAAFAEKYGTNANKRNAFGKCVSQKAKDKEAEADAEDKEDAAALKNAAKECDAERDADAAAFKEKYGTNANKRNAFGKCVSQKARENETEEQA